MARINRKLIIILFFFLNALNVLDLITTVYGLSHGIARENNLFLQHINKGISPQFLLIKVFIIPLAFCSIAYLGFLRVEGFYRLTYYCIVLFLVFYYSILVFNNFIVLGENHEQA